MNSRLPVNEGEEQISPATIAKQQLVLPKLWKSADYFIVRATELSLLVVGVTFTLMVVLEVVSRYLFNFSVYFVNSAARQLLVWFFLLGAGLALRYGAHVGFELALRALGDAQRRLARTIGQLLVLVFLLQMFWSGLNILGPAMRQTDAALGITLFWVMLAFPIGFGLMIYHLVTLIAVGYRATTVGHPS